MQVQLGRDSENSLCNNATDGQVTFSQPPAWGVRMESTLPSTFWGMEITQAALPGFMGAQKYVSFHLSSLVQNWSVQGIQVEENTQSWWAVVM